MLDVDPRGSRRKGILPIAHDILNHATPPPPTLHSNPPSSFRPRRDTRSANNPPAHPEDERRRARSLPASDCPPKTLLGRGPRHPPRHAPSRRFVCTIFATIIFLLKWNVWGSSGDPKIDFKLFFSTQNTFPGPFVGPLMVRTWFSSLF